MLLKINDYSVSGLSQVWQELIKREFDQLDMTPRFHSSPLQGYGVHTSRKILPAFLLVGCVRTKVHNAPKIWDGALAFGITHPTFKGFGVTQSFVYTP